MKNRKAFFDTINREIYCFADTIPLCKKLLDGGAKVIQLRDKHTDEKAFYQKAIEMFSLVRQYDETIFIINDRVDIAREIKADGIHIGQEDEIFHKVLARVPDYMIVGVSVDTVNQAVEAEKAGASYIGAGSVFPTSTKSDATVIGINALCDIVKSVSIPVVAIGGITMQNIRQVMETGARYFAMISEVNNVEDISARLKELFEILQQGDQTWNLTK
jgi:thiamine-phosphate pyrophosphorylase